jgi:diguanylate cyclase (GGDEF)-like protein
MMALDPRTLLAVMGALNIMYAVMLGLVSLHSGNVKGARHWALGDLCIGASMCLGSQLGGALPLWLVMFAPIGLGLGIGLLYNGIEVFKGSRCNYTVPALLVLLLLAQNIWFVILHPDVHARIVANWLAFGVMYAACARALLVDVEPRLRIACWLAGGSFALVALIAFSRVIATLIAPPDTLRLFALDGINPGVFFVASMAQMSLSFAFMLMISYRLASDLTALASTDALTGLLNRRCLELEAVHVSAHAARSGGVLGIMMIDVDHFKLVNDRYGHPAGDEVLRRLAALMQTVVRSEDYLARYGGEEFCVFLASASEAEAALLAERVRRLYGDLCVDWDGAQLRGTISIGVADSTLAGFGLPGLVAAADRALYRAKNAGRNRVELYSACAAPLDPALYANTPQQLAARATEQAGA